MEEGFFSEVTEPIRFGGLDSTDPLSFKVYQPDRLVMGKRMEDHLRIAVCLWHSFNWPGSRRVRRRDLRPAVARRPARPDGRPPAQKMDAAFEFIDKLGVPFFCFHDRDVAPGGRDVRRDPRQPRRDGRRGGRPHEPDRGQAAVGHGQPVQPSALRGRRGHEPGPRGLRLRRGAGQARCSRRPSGSAARTTSCGAVARATRRCSTPTCAREEAQFARFLHLVAEHKHRIGFNGTLLIEPKPQEPTKHQYDYDCGHRPRLPGPARPRGRVQGQHRGQPRHPGRPQLPPRGRLRDRQRHLRQHRRQPRRLPERLGHRPVPELGRRAVRWRSTRSCEAAGSPPAASTSTRSCAARAWTGPTCSTRTSAGIDTLARALLVAAEHDRARDARAAPRRALRGLERRARAPRSSTVAATLETLEARVGVRRDRSEARVGPAGAARERRQPGDLDRRSSGGRCLDCSRAGRASATATTLRSSRPRTVQTQAPPSLGASALQVRERDAQAATRRLGVPARRRVDRHASAVELGQLLAGDLRGRLADDDHGQDLVGRDVVLVDRADDPAVVHDADPVGQVEHVVDVVADQEDADPLALELPDQVCGPARSRPGRAPRSVRP